MDAVTQLDLQGYKPAEGSFAGKVILVTGAASGIGRALTATLAEEGATVIMLDRKLRHMEKAYDEILQRGHTQPVLLPQDLSRLDEESISKIVAGIEQDFGKLDGIVHNAAELGSPGPLSQYSAASWSAVMQTNLQAPWILTSALISLLSAAEMASVVFGSAHCGRRPTANWGAYSIAYAGIEAQMKIWAAEMKNISAIRFNSLDPGPVNTQMRRVSHPGESPSASASPDEVVSAYLYLLGEDSRAVNGQSLSL
jgi:NAD(P)-dependent dehydrogenase (short-subunit alcohol dehydrogenase family)